MDERLFHTIQRFKSWKSIKTTGKRLNRGPGYGLEIRCQYIVNGDIKMSLSWLKSKVECLGYTVVLPTAGRGVIPVTSTFKQGRVARGCHGVPVTPPPPFVSLF